MTQYSINELNPRFLNLILHLFKRQTSSCLGIFGRRGTGKTDFALLICDILNEFNIVKNFATNIKIYNSSYLIEPISNLQDLESWARNRNGSKVFVFDETGRSFKRRSPMSSLNVQLIGDLQILRKYKLSLIIIAISPKFVDGSVLGPDILDGYFNKPSFRNPKIVQYEDFLENFDLDFRNLPRTNTKFDTWDTATFVKDAPSQKPKFKDDDLNRILEWSKGAPINSLGVHPEQFRRSLRKFTKEILEKQQHETHD